MSPRIIFKTHGMPIIPSNIPIAVPNTGGLWIITHCVYDEKSDTAEYQGIKYDPSSYSWPASSLR